jgi:hypothetical protein
MIQMPRRSVTRFFIPLIDVLTLLFCIFLLLPLIKGNSEDQDASAGVTSASLGSPNRPSPGISPLTAAELERLHQARQELDQIRKTKIEALERRLFIRVLEIDPDTGKLFYPEGDQRLEIRDQEDALRVIAQQREKAGGRELYFLFLYPRRLTGYPQQKQIDQYENWFKGVAHGRDQLAPG